MIVVNQYVDFYIVISDSVIVTVKHSKELTPGKTGKVAKVLDK